MKYSSYSEFCSKNPEIAGCLVPLVKRPAKVGEWVLLTNVLCSTHYHNGEIYKVSEISLGKPVISGKTWGTVLLQSEYEVLDGYAHEPEKEPEPVYWSGKVVCVKTNNGGLTAGRLYEIKDGVFTWNDGYVHKEHKFLSFEDFNGCFSTKYGTNKFIPFLGEA